MEPDRAPDWEVPMWRRHVLVALIVGMPTVLLAWRLLTDDRAFYGWGWQMFS